MFFKFPDNQNSSFWTIEVIRGSCETGLLALYIFELLKVLKNFAIFLFLGCLRSHVHITNRKTDLMRNIDYGRPGCSSNIGDELEKLRCSFNIK